MQISFLGGADEVGASCLLLEIGGRRLLIDAGLRPSPKARWGLAGDQLPDLSLIDQSGPLDAILVTHAHTDHTGALELVVGRCPECPVYATPVTIALTRVLHADSRRIMRTRLEEEGELPLFDEVATQKLLAAFVPVPFRTRLPLGEGLTVTFYPAGHIAGAACLAIESDEGRVLISGDVSISPQRTVDGLKPPPFRPDLLVLESTYGGRLHANRAIEERRLATTIAEVVTGGGKVLIPAFALGRAQEVMLALSELRRRGEFPAVPVWVDGMVRAVCQAYTQFPDALPLALQERQARFFDEWVRPIERLEQRNALQFDPTPAVIISSSGMLAGGPSVGYARALAGHPQHAILLTGYQDEESPGRRLQSMAVDGRGTLRLGQDRIDVQCRLGTYSLSAHADEAQLVSLTETLDPAEVFLVHGDEAARSSLAQALRERGRQVTLPRAGQTFTRRYAAAPAAKRASRLGAGRPLDLRDLWQAVAEPGGGYYTLSELAQAWWGDPNRTGDLEKALAEDNVYFVPDERRQDWVRARTAAQVEAARRRREQLATYAVLAGRWLIIRDGAGEFRVARCATVAGDHFRVVGDDLPHWPDELIDVVEAGEAGLEIAAIETLAAALDPAQLLLPDTPRTIAELPGKNLNAKVAAALAVLRGGGAHTSAGYSRALTVTPAVRMEPNQALAFARAQFPSEARLRKCGYRLDQAVLTLTFDFPSAAQAQFLENIERVRAGTGWEVEVDPETNQGALTALIHEVLPAGWKLVRGPAIHRAERRVVISVSSGAQTRIELNEMCTRFQSVSGWELSATVSASALAGASRPAPAGAASDGTAWEINAAYTEIKRALADSGLYRASLRNNEIVLSFISPQVGERHRDQITPLAVRIGWPLSINTQPNQNAIQEAARTLIARAG